MHATSDSTTTQRPSTGATLAAVIEAGEDFEWYPTTDRMIDVVARHLPRRFNSLMDIGAGDGRVLRSLAKRSEHEPELYSIEKSPVLVQAQPEGITPVGCDFYEQNLACLPVDYIFCNPPYSDFEAWAANIVESGYAKKAFLVIPQRWKDSDRIKASIKRRGATVRVIHSDNFHDAERRARAVVDIVEVAYPKHDHRWEEVKDPFDIWFDQNIDTFDREGEPDDEAVSARDLARIRGLGSIGEMVDAFNEEYARMEENYRAIFRLDLALLRELSVDKEGVREGIKKRMAGLKAKYWELLFERLDTITNRLSTATKERFVKKLTGRASIAFTASNAYAVVLWAIKNANRYYDEQLVQLFKDVSTFDGVMGYKSNQRTWERDQWRFRDAGHTHYALDYRIVVSKYQAVGVFDFGAWEYPGHLHRTCHELIADVVAVLYNLGFPLGPVLSSYQREWGTSRWQDFRTSAGDTLFQVKAFKNGNLHFRFMPEAIKALNVEAGRLLGWLRTHSDVVAELGYTPEEAAQYFGSNRLLTPGSVKLLAAPPAPPPPFPGGGSGGTGAGGNEGVAA